MLLVSCSWLQQYLPFTVLKPLDASAKIFSFIVATVLTVYGIETSSDKLRNNQNLIVATVLTVYGIETGKTLSADVRYLQLQQYLPFTVLKRSNINAHRWFVGSCNSTYRLRY